MKKTISVYFACGALFFFWPFPLPAGTTWTRILGGENDDWAQSLKQTSDGGFIITGGTRSFGSGESDLWLIKLDSSGETLWSRTYGGIKNDYGVGVIETSDSNYAVLGVTESYGAAKNNFWLMKIKKNGDKIWATTYGGSDKDIANNFRQTADDGFIIVGETHSSGSGTGDLWLIKTNAQGKALWSKNFGGDSLDWGEDVCETPDGGYIVAGGTRSFGVIQTDLWILKVDSIGNQKWSQTYGWRSWEWGKCMHETGDGGYIIAGQRDTSGAGLYDAWLVKVDSLGDTSWTRRYGGKKWDMVYSVDVTSDSGYILAGESESYGSGKCDIWLLKTDTLGDSIWAYTYGGSDWEWGSSVTEAADGDIAVAGATSSFNLKQSDLCLIRINSDGALEIEVSPVEILLPQKQGNYYSILPEAVFANFSRNNTVNPYFHCVIESPDSQTIYYHDSLREEIGIWSCKEIEFPEWITPGIGEYKAVFYSAFPDYPSMVSRPMSVTFHWTGIAEPEAHPSPSIELVQSLGTETLMDYSNYPSGFRAEIFDASGRKVDELRSGRSDGTLEWGKGQPPGVYFVRTDRTELKTLKVIIVR